MSSKAVQCPGTDLCFHTCSYPHKVKFVSLILVCRVFFVSLTDSVYDLKPHLERNYFSRGGGVSLPALFSGFNPVWSAYVGHFSLSLQ